jgi:hypothetical protein
VDLVYPPQLLIGGLACTPPLSRGEGPADATLESPTREQLYGVTSGTVTARTDIYGKRLHLTVLGGRNSIPVKIRVGSAPLGRARAVDGIRTFRQPPGWWNISAYRQAYGEDVLVRCLDLRYYAPRLSCAEDAERAAYCPQRISDRLVLVASDGTGLLSNAAMMDVDIEVVTRGGGQLPPVDDTLSPSWTSVFLVLNFALVGTVVFGLVRRRRLRRHRTIPNVDLDIGEDDSEMHPAVREAQRERESAEALPRPQQKVLVHRGFVAVETADDAIAVVKHAENRGEDEEDVDHEEWRRNLREGP